MTIAVEAPQQHHTVVTPRSAPSAVQAPSDAAPSAAYPPMDDLVPHGVPIRAVEEMLHWEPGAAVCRMRVRRHTPFVREDRLATVVTLEFMAQAVAACLGYAAYLGGGRVRVGMIIGVRRMDLFAPSIALGAELRLEVEKLRGDDDLSTFQAHTFADDHLVSSALMTIVHPEVPPELEAPPL